MRATYIGARATRAAPDMLTKSEIALLLVWGPGCTTRAAAAALGITVGATQARALVVREKLGVETMDEAVAAWRRQETEAA